MRPCCVLLLALALPAAAQEKAETAKVEGTFVIPKEVGSFAGRVVEIRLYKYDPRIADRAADLVEKVELPDFAHAAGTETKKAFVVGAKADLDPRASYYLTFFVLDGGKRTHMGKCRHDKQGIGKVLTNGHPRAVTVDVAEIKR